MTFNGSGANESFRLSANGTRTRLTRDVGNIRMNVDGIERVDLTPSGGQDAVTVEDLAGTRLRTINSDLANDGAADTTIVNAGEGDDAITVTGAAGSATVTGALRTLNLRGAEAGSDALTINGRGGKDRIDASGLGAAVLKLTADGGTGDDTLLGSRGDDALLGGNDNDAIDGNQGNDTAFMGANDDRFTWDPGDGSDVVRARPATTPWPSTEPTSPRPSTCRPTAGACASSATSRTSRWTSTTSRASPSTRSAAPTR
jgi:hypothetical protein